MDHDAVDSPIWQAANSLRGRTNHTECEANATPNHGQIGQPANKSHSQQGCMTSIDTRKAVKIRSFLVFMAVGGTLMTHFTDIALFFHL